MAVHVAEGRVDFGVVCPIGPIDRYVVGHCDWIHKWYYTVMSAARLDRERKIILSGQLCMLIKGSENIKKKFPIVQ